MNRLIILFTLVFGIGGVVSCQQTNTSTAIVPDFKAGTKQVKKKLAEPTFDIELQVQQLKDQQYRLIAKLELEKGTYVISPLSKDSFYLPFQINIPENDKFNIDKTIVEQPSSKEEYDELLDKRVRFVRQNTTYTKNITILGQDDFEVSGLIELLHEPVCIPYDVAFVLRYRSEKLTVEKTKTSISSEYKL